jgi:hypothetical protein
MKKDISYKILNFLIGLGIVITLVALLIVPQALSDMLKQTGKSIAPILFMGKDIVDSSTIGIYICAVPYVIALFLLKRLCKLLSKNNTFLEEVPKLLKNIATCAFIDFVLVNLIAVFIAFIYIFDKDMFFSTIMISNTISLVILVIGLLSLVSSKLFKRAIDIKSENDKTI